MVKYLNFKWVFIRAVLKLTMFSISRADLGLGRIMLLNLFSLLMVAVLSTQLK